MEYRYNTVCDSKMCKRRSHDRGKEIRNTQEYKYSVVIVTDDVKMIYYLKLESKSNH